MKRIVGFILLSMMGVIFAGCMAVPASTAPSTKPLSQDGYTTLGKAKGRAVGVYVLGILPLSEPYPARKSVDRAIAKGGGDALVDLTTDHMVLPIPFVSITISTTQGTAVQTKPVAQ